MGAMPSSPHAKIDTDYAETPSDTRVPKDEEESNETDALLSDKAAGKHVDTSDFPDYTLGMKPFLTDLSNVFGYKLLSVLFASQFLLKGFANDFAGRAEPYIYKLYHVPANRMQIYQGVSQLPWAIKPIIGLVSDLFPVRGYNKAPYMLITSTLGVAAFLLVGFSSPDSLPVQWLVVAFIVIQFQGATCDLLTEAKYAEKIRDVPEQGPALMTYVWFGMQVAGLIAVIFAGGAISRFGPHSLYIVAAFPAAALFVPVAMNYMQETPLTTQKRAEAWARFMNQGETIVLCALMLFGTATMCLVGLNSTGSMLPQAIAAVTVAIVILAGFSILLSPTIAKFNAFSLIQTACSFQVGGAAFYFYTDTEEQYPEGPHFSPFFFNTVVGVVTCVVSLLGIYTYQRYMTTWTYRSIFIATNLGYSLICFPDILMFARYNLVLGIPDHVFMIGSAVAQNIVGQWQWMPQVVILANLCPKGMEATMYALLAGSHNLGMGIGSYCGALMLEFFECTPSGAVGESAMFDNLWKAAAVSGVLPLLTILLIPYLIPDARQDEQILHGADDSATNGSLWRRWRGIDAEPHTA